MVTKGRCFQGVAPLVLLNLHRRHLNESQRAMVAAKLANLDHGMRSDTQICDSVTQPEAAEMLNVSTRAVSSAKQVLKKATPETIAAVESGKLPVSVATQHIAAVSKYPELASPQRKSGEAFWKHRRFSHLANFRLRGVHRTSSPRPTH